MWFPNENPPCETSLSSKKIPISLSKELGIKVLSLVKLSPILL